MYRGDIRLGDTLDVKFCTVTTTGAPTTLAGSPVVSAYVGNGTTEITAGITLSVDFDSRTGMHNVRVVATSGNGFATATNVDLVLTAGTVGGTSVVGYVIGSFSIENRSGLMPTTAARTLDVSAGGEAGLDWANIGSPTTAVNLSATNIDVDQIVASVSGAVGSVTGAVGSVAGAVGSVTGGVGGNLTGSVGSVATGGIAAASFAAGAIDAAAIAANAIGASEIADGAIDAATFAANAINAAALAADAGTEIAAAVLAAAVATPIDANVQKVNDVTLLGDGNLTPWGPV